MPALGRLNGEDFVFCGKHWCRRRLCCRHAVRGPAISGARRTFINGFQALRIGDRGLHDAQVCCGRNRWIAFQCVAARGVYIEGREAFCVGDLSLHDRRDQGRLMVGSPNVFVGG